MKMKKTMVPREIADVMYPHLANQAAQGFGSKGKVRSLKMITGKNQDGQDEQRNEA